MKQRKEDSLLSRLGNGIGESIGMRADEEPLPSYGSGAPPRRDFKVDRDIGEIDIDKVCPDPLQPRKEFSDESLDQLAADIEQRTQLQPIGVRWDEEKSQWIIMYGERRWRAIQRKGLTTIKCRFFMGDVSEEEIRSIQLTENLQRENLKPIEEAQAFRDLMTANNWAAKKVAEYLNVSSTKVGRALKLLELPEGVQTKVEQGEIAPSTAYQIAKEKNPIRREDLVTKVLAGELDVRTARQKTAKTKADGTAATRRSTNELFQVSHRLRVVVSGRKHVGDAGVLEALLEAVEKQRAKLHTTRKAA